MHIDFWSALENHKWRNSQNNHHQRALLTYQGQQHRKWHICITSPRVFDLSVLNEDVLRNTLEDLLMQNKADHMDVIHSTHSDKTPPFFSISHCLRLSCNANMTTFVLNNQNPLWPITRMAPVLDILSPRTFHCYPSNR
ncbi:hypothetical protein JVT61DRAFT_14592 [Boletus reticuloceps]|uniref:Uncharacterized protein n=1 Tax=Boletus reticuloceps TaxID=495285 RepID=A0A8I2YU80_9AGAM|nr:hypothetical protein JVT61DRAFT_14592 [Boletus reticuloceps]